MKGTIIYAIAILLALPLMGQRTTRGALKRAQQTESATQRYDTIMPKKDVVKIAGYEKTLRSTTESFFVTNNSQDSIMGIHLTIDYRDMQGRQLHQRTETIQIEVPPMQTRLAKLPSWDKQKVWYYRLSENPRTRGQSTPYDVKITFDWILLRSPQPDQRPSY